MSSSRYPDNRFPRDRSPYRENRDRRPSTYGGGYPPRGNDPSNRPNADSNAFPPRDVPRGPKSLVDAPRGSNTASTSGLPSGPRDTARDGPRDIPRDSRDGQRDIPRDSRDGPRDGPRDIAHDGRGRGFAGRGEPPSLRDAPPLGTNHPVSNHANSWRPGNDRGRDFDRRDRRPSPRRSPIRDSRDSRDFPPRDIDINRARRNSRDGPPSAGSTYSDPPLNVGQSYRGGGGGRGRGTGRDFGGDMRGRGRPWHNDDRDRHDARDRMPDRPYRARSRSREPVRRDRDFRDTRDDRDFDRRDRDDQRFPPKYDSYTGSGNSMKPGMRALDTHRGSGAVDARHLPGTPTGPPTPHSSHHVSAADRLGPPADSYSRRSSIAVEPLSAKDARRESEQNNLLAIRAEASRERYAPRASSPPAAVPAFGFSNVWRNPALDAKPAVAISAPKPVPSTPSVSVAPAPASTAAVVPTAPKASGSSSSTTVIPAGPKIPPTGPKADRVPDRPQGDHQSQDSRPPVVERPRNEPPSRPPTIPTPTVKLPVTEYVEPRPTPPAPAPPQATAPIPISAPAPIPSHAISPPLGPAPRARAPPTGPQSTLRQNVSPSFTRPSPQAPYAARDVSPVAMPSSVIPRNPMAMITSPKSMPANIPTGPKADRANPMAPRPQMYGPPDRSGFSANPNFSGPRLPLGAFPKSHQWVKPGLNRVPSIPTKREFPGEDRERTFGTAPKAPKLEGSTTATEAQRTEQPSPKSPVLSRLANETEGPKDRAPAIQSQPPKAPSPKPTKIETRRMSDVSMSDASPRTDKIPVSATSSTAEIMEDSDDDLDLDEDDFAESEAKYKREVAHLRSRLVDLTASHLRANTPLQDIMMLASLTIDHIPHQQTKPVDEEMISLPSVQPPPESITTDLLTPKAEEAEDVIMNEKEAKPLAPATQALRLRRESSPEQETVLDLSSLPYLDSGPPTPLSDLEQDRPTLPESLMLAIRTNLIKDIEPELDPEDTLRQYANAYRQWRLHIREFDDTQEFEDQDRQPSIEPGLKATTPDIQSSAMGPMLDAPPMTGRRSHSSRWATELDFEQVIKESLKTAEEERMGKKDKEPRKSMADPEREATVPLELTVYDAQRRRFIDTNFQREPGQGIFVYHYEPPEDDFTEAEHKIMVTHYKDQYAKKWGKLAEILYKEAGTSRTYKDCINHYYATKWGREYKGKVKGRRGGPRKRGGGATRGRGNLANIDRSEMPGEDGLTPLALTETGRPRRSAAPTFGAESEFDTNASTPTPGRLRRPTDADGAQEKVDRRRKAGKEKTGRKPKNQVLAAAPAGSPIKVDRTKERALGVKTEEDPVKRSLGEMPLPIQMQMGLEADQMTPPHDLQVHPGLGVAMSERSRPQPANARPGPSSYWSVTEQNDFQRNVAHFGTDWVSIANHMGTKTHTMVRNQYLRSVESGQFPELQRNAEEADQKRERGEDLGPPPTPTPAQKRRYESAQTNVPRTLAPTPELADLLKSPAALPAAPPKASPPQFPPSVRLSTIAQAPLQAKPHGPTSESVPMSEPALVAVPSMSQQHSPPVPPPRAQPSHHHQPPITQHKSHHAGPRAGFFSDDLRAETRPLSQSASMAQPPRISQQPIQPQSRAQEQSQAPMFRGPPITQERDLQSRVEPQQERDPQPRFQPQHIRRISQEHPHHRLFQSHMSGTAQMMPQIRSGHGAGSPENRPSSMHHPRHMMPSQPSSHNQAESVTQVPSGIPGAPQQSSRSTLGNPPVKEEPRHFPMASSAQPPAQSQPHTQSQGYVQPPVQAPPSVPPAPASKPATEPRKSNLLSLLNDTEPEEPRRKKPAEQSIPSHTSTPQQQAPIAPPPPSISHALPPRRDPYNDPSTSQAPYSRSSYAQQAPISQAPSNRAHFVDLTSEQAPSSGGRPPPPREPWQQRQHFHGAQSQAQPSSALNSPRASLVQPMFGGDSRIFGNHRSLLGPANGPRHNPSPPPLSAYNHSPHTHSRTPSLSGASSQQPRHGVNSTTPQQHPQTAGSAQILQPNPYAQVDPPGSSSQTSGPVGMRPSPHLHTSHVAQQRDLQGRNEQSQVHNGALNYPNPHVLSENHPQHQHLRGPSLSEHYRARDAHRDFDPRNPQRDMSMEVQHRADALLRDQRETLHNSQLRSTATPSSHQDLRYQPPQQDRGYAAQRSHTPLARTEHNTHPPLQHPPHSSLADNSHPIFRQRQQEEPPQRFRNPFPPQDERDRFTDRMREEQAQQHPGLRAGEEYGRDREIRERQLRERDAQFREDLMRREREAAPRAVGPPPPGPGQHGQQEQRQVSGGSSSMDWANAVRPPPQDRWQHR